MLAAPPAESPRVPNPNEESKQARFYIPALDGLRTVAFLMVWVVHAIPVDRAFGAPPLPLALGFVQAGIYGVPVFFVLSAFLITRLLLTEREQNGRIDLRAYYVRRTLRIWPLYFLMVGLAVAHWKLREGAVPSGQLFSLLTFTANWYKALGGAFTNFSHVLWSISVEEQFYLVWPFVLVWLSPQGLRKLCWAMVVVAFVSRIAFVEVQHTWYGVWQSTLSHLDSLALGTLLALESHRLPRLSMAKWYAAFAACVVALGVQATLFPLTFRGTPLDVLSTVGYTLVPFIAVAMVALALISKGSLLENPRMVAVGRLTFGMYCYHQLVIDLLNNTDPLRIAASLVATLAVAWASYHGYEKRFLKLKCRFERVQTRPAA